MTTMIETPGLLIHGNEQDYLNIIKDLYSENNTIVLPDFSKPLFVYTNKDTPLYHIWRGGGYAGLREEDFNFNEPKFYRRAQRILWIRFLLENPKFRQIYRDKRNGYICFLSIELEYTVVLKELKNSFLLITAYHMFDSYSYMKKTDRFEKINGNIKEVDECPSQPLQNRVQGESTEVQ